MQVSGQKEDVAVILKRRIQKRVILLCLSFILRVFWLYGVYFALYHSINNTKLLKIDFSRLLAFFAFIQLIIRLKFIDISFPIGSEALKTVYSHFLTCEMPNA